MCKELRICNECKKEKILTDFTRGKVKEGKILYRYLCKKCHNLRQKNSRSGIQLPEEKKRCTRFKKGHTGGKRFEKGHVSWSKLNNGKYRFERRGIGRGTANDKEWIVKVKERDNYTCRECGSQKNIEAHHMYDFEKYPEKRFDLDNGVSLCKSCHMRITRMQEQLKSCKILWLKD